MKIPIATKKLTCSRQGCILFSDLSFHLHSGEMMLIEGPNGAGKSSLLRLLASLATPASGEILWHDKSIVSCPTEYRQQLHFIGHTNGLRLDLTVVENLHHLEVQDVLSELHLIKYIHMPARSLSAGQKRKLALARLFSSQKKLWLLDEPLTALDADTQRFFLTRIKQHLQQGGIAIVSSHQPILLAGVNMQTIKLQGR